MGILSDSEGIQHKSLVENIVENIEARVLKRELKPGDRLIEQAMCDQLKVSGSPLREAFRILENRGFLVNRARKGVFVSELSKTDAIDAYTIRANLESLAIFLAVKNDDGTLADRLSEINGQMLFFADKGDSWNYADYNQRDDRGMQKPATDRHAGDFRQADRSLPGGSHALDGQMQDSIRKRDAEQAEKIRKESILANIDIVSNLF
ncbi:MAG: GntR family transcriptional regulator [Synergistales bacterium]